MHKRPCIRCYIRHRIKDALFIKTSRKYTHNNRVMTVFWGWRGEHQLYHFYDSRRNGNVGYRFCYCIEIYTLAIFQFCIWKIDSVIKFEYRIKKR